MFFVITELYHWPVFLFFLWDFCDRILLNYNIEKKWVFLVVVYFLLFKVKKIIRFKSPSHPPLLFLVTVTFNPNFWPKCSDLCQFRYSFLSDSFFSPWVSGLVLSLLVSQGHCGLGQLKRTAADLLRLGRCFTIFKYFGNLPLRENGEDHEDIS